jgi:hypothetical protein
VRLLRRSLSSLDGVVVVLDIPFPFGLVGVPTCGNEHAQVRYCIAAAFLSGSD